MVWGVIGLGHRVMVVGNIVLGGLGLRGMCDPDPKTPAPQLRPIVSTLYFLFGVTFWDP